MQQILLAIASICRTTFKTILYSIYVILAFIMFFGTVEGLDSRNVAFPEYLFYFLFYFDLGMLLCNLNLQHKFTIDLL